MITNAVTVLIGILTVTIVPRALGPFAYGQFGFLKTNFNTIINFLSIGSALAFFNYNSKNKNSYMGIVFYSFFCILVVLAALSAIWLSAIFKLHNYFWPEIQLEYIVLGAFLGIATWLFSIVTGFADSKGETVNVELLKVAAKVFGILFLVLLFFSELLNLRNYLLYSIFFYLPPILLALIYYRRIGLAGRRETISPDKLKLVGKYFYGFCAPLFIYFVFSLIYDFFDSWFLQIIAGSVEQGYYSLAFNFASVCILIITAMTPIFMREMSKAHGESRLDIMRVVFSRYTRMMYLIIATLGVFFAFHAMEVVSIFCGDKFQNASWSFFLMALSPLSAVYGQLNASLFFATERTAHYRNILLLLMILFMPVTYFFIAPRDFLIGGCGLGAIGLSLKKLLTQFIAVNTLTYFNCKFLKIPFGKFLTHQLFIVSVLVLSLWVIKGGDVMSASSNTGENIVRIIIDGFIYVMVVFGVVYCKPDLMGLGKEEVLRLKKKVLKF